VRRTERPAPRAEPPQARATPARGPAASILALQRSAGNAAVARILQRDSWPEARAGGWNAKNWEVAGTLRVVLKGLPIGFKDQDPSSGGKDEDGNKFGPATTEFAGDGDGARAIVVVPKGTKFASDKLEVLILYHGLGTRAGIAYRERSKPTAKGDAAIGAEGTVHDVENDLIEQQLRSSGRNMIAVLPQGRATGSFGSDRFQIPDPAAYVAEVLKKLKPELAALQPPVAVPGNLKPYRIVSAGHSGGGPYAVAAADSQQGSDWARAAPLLLFDAINGPNELKKLRGLLTQWLEQDKAHLTDPKTKNPEAELDRRGLKLRSTYSTGSDEVYKKNHVGGTYKLGDATVRILRETDKYKDLVKDPMCLTGFLNHWFDDNANGLLAAPVMKKWRDQYVTEEVTGSHHFQVGVGKVAGKTERDTVAPGTVPQYTAGTGHLEQALKLLGPVP
jgi:hypothetical protein